MHTDHDTSFKFHAMKWPLKWTTLAVSIILTLVMPTVAAGSTCTFSTNTTFSFDPGKPTQGPLLTPGFFSSDSGFGPMPIQTSLGAYTTTAPGAWYGTTYEFYVIGKPTSTTGVGSPFFGNGHVADSSCGPLTSCYWEDLNNTSLAKSAVQIYTPFSGLFGASSHAAAPWLLSYSQRTDFSGTWYDENLLFPYDELGDNGGNISGMWQSPVSPPVSYVNQVCEYNFLKYTSPIPTSFALDDLGDNGACEIGDSTNCVLYVASSTSNLNANAGCTPSSGAPAGNCIYYWNNTASSWTDTTTYPGGYKNDCPGWTPKCGGSIPCYNCGSSNVCTGTPNCHGTCTGCDPLTCGGVGCTGCQTGGPDWGYNAWTNVQGATGTCYGPDGLSTSSISCAGASQITYDVWPTTHVLYALDNVGQVWKVKDDTTGSRPIAATGGQTWAQLPTVAYQSSCGGSTVSNFMLGQIAAYNGVVFGIRTDSSLDQHKSACTGCGSVYEFNTSKCTTGWVLVDPTDPKMDSISANPGSLAIYPNNTSCTYPECALVGSDTSGNLQQVTSCP